jgi:hypothetical protein
VPVASGESLPVADPEPRARTGTGPDFTVVKDPFGHFVVAVPAATLRELPDQVDDMQGALVEPGRNALRPHVLSGLRRCKPGRAGSRAWPGHYWHPRRDVRAGGWHGGAPDGPC